MKNEAAFGRLLQNWRRSWGDATAARIPSQLEQVSNPRNSLTRCRSFFLAHFSILRVESKLAMPSDPRRKRMLTSFRLPPASCQARVTPYHQSFYQASAAVSLEAMVLPSPSCYLLQPSKNLVVELRRSGIPRCNCLATPITSTVDARLPVSVDVVMLARLSTARDFLMLDRWDVKCIVYEPKPDSMADVDSFYRFMHYLKQGRDGSARAGVALDMEAQGFKIFILPPGGVARAFGYDGDMMLAVLRSR